ncbi:MAG: hypothetical protein AAF193_04055 [Bacteroidota bacterium]
MMKKTITSALLMFITTIAIAQQENHEALDRLVQHFHESVANNDPFSAASCFAPSLLSNIHSDSTETCTRSEFLGEDPLKLLNQLESQAKGFVLQSDGTYVNLQNIHYQNTGEIEIKTNGLALRRSPDISSALIARMNMGTYSGYERDDGLVTFDQENNIIWIPVKIFLQDMGWVKGYVAKKYVEIEYNTLLYQMTVSETTQWIRISEVKLVPRLSSSPLTSL